MYRLRRLRLENVGHSAAGFKSMVLDLTGGPSTVDGTAVDTIVWLRNGGGKSSLLSLFFSLLLPAKVDFIGHAKEKSLADYVPDGQVSHVIAEWEDSARPGTGAVLVTGGVYQWRDGHRPADPGAGWERLVRRWYLFRPQAGGMEMDTLPVRREDGQLSQAAFLRTLEEAYKVERRLQLVVTEEQYTWAEQLNSHGLDPQVLKIQRDMNRDEGGITELFHFSTCEDFVDFLIDLIVDAADPAAVRSALAVQADKLATRPARELEQKFLAEAVLRLRPVQSGAADLVAARHTLEQQLQVAGRAGDLIEGRAQELLREAEVIDAAAARARQEAGAAGQHAAQEKRHVTVLRQEVARCEVVEAQQAQAACTAAQEKAELEHHAWGAVAPVLELESRRRELAQVRELLERRDEEQAPLREAVERAGAALCDKLTTAAEQLGGELAQAQLAWDRAQEQAAAADQERLAAVEAGGRSQAQLEAARGRLVQVSEQVGAARAESALQEQESPRQGLERLDAQVLEAQELLEHHQGQERAARSEVERIAAERTVCAARLGEVRERHNTVWDKVSTLQGQRRDLQREPRLRELAGLAEADALDLEAVGGDLVALLGTQIEESDVHLAQERAGAAEDQRVREALERDGFRPPSREVEQALDALRGLGASAVTGLQFLRDTVPAHRHDHVIATAPHLVGGVVVCGHVPEGDLAALGRRTGVALDAVVTVSADAQVRQAVDAAEGGSIVLPIHPAVLDPQAAEQELQRVTRRLEGLSGRLREIVERRTEDLALLQRLRAHLDTFGAGARSALESGVAQLDAELDSLQEREQDLAQQAKDLDGTVHQAVQQVQHLTGGMPALADRLRRMQTLATDFQQVPDLEDLVRRSREDIAEHRRTVQRCTRQWQQAEARADDAAADVRRCTGTRERWTRELGTVHRELPDGARHTLSRDELALASVETLRARWTQACQDARAGISQDGLQQRLTACQDAITALTEQLETVTGAAHERAVELAAGADAAEPRRRAVCLNRAEKDHAEAKRASIESALLCRQAEERHLEARAAVAELDPPAAELTCTGSAQALGQLEAAQAAVGQAQEQAHRCELEAERALREADTARSQAESLAASAQTLSAAVARYRGEAEPTGPEPTELLGLDSLLLERHQFTVRSAHSLVPLQARNLQDALVAEVDGAARNRDTSRKNVERAMRQVERLTQQPDYATVVDGRLLERLQHDLTTPKRLAELLEDIAARERVVTDQLAELAEDQLMIVQACAGLVHAVLDDLEEVARHSRLPQGLGNWSGQRFLGLEIRHQAGEEELARRLSAEVDKMTSALDPAASGKASALPDPMTLTKRLVLAALGGRGNIVAKIIKPTQSLDAVERNSVTQIKKFSGGELLTVSVLLYCTLARMRAAKRDRKIPGGVGTLLLDNPFGKANYAPFIGLQRRVAGAHGIQLVYTTGTNDLPALGSFPLILRLRNGVDARTRGRYVQIVERYGDAAATGVERGRQDGIAAARLLRRSDASALPEGDQGAREHSRPEPQGEGDV